ncbi:MAG: HEAT repeat domain-containing protein [Aggregatilineales bacterium]
MHSDRAVKQLVHYHIARLKDKNPAVRLKAINELALLGDPEALEALEAVFQQDPNSEVKKAAQAAGRAIFLKLRAHENENNSTS